jgi:peptidoglycan/xylan/chitin deacetylase (PgdA/CDA1 family)
LSIKHHLARSVARCADRVVAPKPGISVLIYHRVGGQSDSAVDLPMQLFAEQMRYLGEQQLVVSLDQAVAALAAGDHSFDGRVVITFDDGTSDFAEVAAPLLNQLALPATLYLATKFVDEQVSFPWGAPPLTWSALSDVCAAGGVMVGSHTHAHHLLDRVTLAEAADDLDRSIDLIGTHLGYKPAHFAYPKAIPPTAAAHDAVRGRFVSAALARSRINVAGRTDPHGLWRTPIQRSDTLADFIAMTRGGLRLEGELRAAVARVKYRRSER